MKFKNALRKGIREKPLKTLRRFITADVSSYQYINDLNTIKGYPFFGQRRGSRIVLLEVLSRLHEAHSFLRNGEGVFQD